MRPFEAPILTFALPEILLAVLAMAILLAGALTKARYKIMAGLAVMALIATGAVLCRMPHEAAATFGNMFVTDHFAVYMKLLVLGGAGISLLMAGGYLARNQIDRFEYPVLVLFSVIGMMLMISANDLISLYMAIELQSLPLYVLAAINRDNLRSTEAGLKYFILGALSSGLLLYGASLIYGYAGATSFPVIADALRQSPDMPLGIITGMVMMAAGLAFKVSAAPFHMWAPDVYEGAPSPVTAFFAIVPKLAGFALLLRFFTGAFGDVADVWRQVIIALSVASMTVGAVGALVQSNIKRLLAYSSIGHMGYALIGLVAAGSMGLRAVIVYLTLYMIMSIGVFCVVLMMRKKGQAVEGVSDLAGIAKSRPGLAFAMALLMFSMAGIPPLAGFFGKLFIFQSAVSGGFYALAIFGVITSVIAAYYYLRIIKVMYFDESAGVLDACEDSSLKIFLFASTLFSVFFIVAPSPFLQAASVAAQALIR
jgi:NADH-quinone oxidoreductase subunit N